MNKEAMNRALQLESAALRLLDQINRMQLAQAGAYGMKEEVIACGRPKQGERDLALEYIPIPPSARRHVFTLWKRDAVLRYNAMVREINQLGMSGHGLELLAAGEPQ